MQFAKGKHSGTPYAIKFCITPSAFQVERAVYGNRELAHVVPRVAATVANTDGSFCDPDGTPMPPCIVIERGRALDDWAARHKPNVTTVAQVRPPHSPPPLGCSSAHRVIARPVPSSDTAEHPRQGCRCRFCGSSGMSKVPGSARYT